MVKLQFDVHIKFRVALITFGTWSYTDTVTLHGEAAVIESILSPLLARVKYDNHGVKVSLTQVPVL